MASFPKLADGKLDERVRIRVAGLEANEFESYEVQASIFQPPGSFSGRFGSNLDLKWFRKFMPPRTLVEVMVGPVVQFVGLTEGSVADSGPDGSFFDVRGRDFVHELRESDVLREISVENATYMQLVERAIKEAGLEPVVQEDPKAPVKVGQINVFADNSAQRKIRSGVGVKAVVEPERRTTEVVQTGTGTTVKHVVHAKLGESWYDFIDRHLKGAGLVLFGCPQGLCVITPNAHQEPTYLFSRGDRATPKSTEIERGVLREETSGRKVKWTAYGRSAGRKAGWQKAKGTYDDEEMKALGYKRERIYRDTNATTATQAASYARRKAAEANRAAWQLTYTFSGHTAPSLVGGGRAVIVPDTVAQVDDPILGVSGPYYVESVTYRAPPTSVTVRLMRPEDVELFEEG